MILGPISASMENISDEDYLVLRAKEAQKCDAFQAKAWLITARTLFPKNFKIQFEAYFMHKSSGNIQEAAKNLELMFRNFKNEEILWREVRMITDSLRVETLDANSKFLKDLYFSLPVDIQRGLLLRAAERCSDMIEHCKLFIMVLQEFPECISQHGMRLIDNLVNTEQHTCLGNPVNSLRKFLVCDILPLVLKTPNVDVSQKYLFKLLISCIEFCVYSVMKPLDRGQDFAGNTGGREKGTFSDSPWNHLEVIMHLIGKKLGWDSVDISKANDLDAQWQHLQSLFGRMSAGDDSTSYHYLQVFYSAVALFMRSFCSYALLVDPSHSFDQGSTASENTSAVVLIEGLRVGSGESLERHKAKKLKLDVESKEEATMLACSTQLGQSGNTVVSSFLTAIRCWNLLHSSTALASDFAQLCQQLLVDTWTSFLNFQVDVLIYKGLYKDAMQCMSNLPVQNIHGYREKMTLQSACCSYQLGDYVPACAKAMDVVNFMSEKAGKCDKLSESMTPLIKPVRHLVFLSLTMSDVLHFCIKLLVSRLKETALHPAFSNDVCVGHLIVLLQYDWPQEESLFMDVIELIRHHGSFTYGCFFNYVINIDILEEFTHLSLPAGGSLMLNLLSDTATPGIKQRTMTRGVYKGAEKELRAAVERQVTRCGESLLPLLVMFLNREQETLFRNVNHG